jgi:uncharacterized tellurite resistance protein B-like protein
MLLSLRGLFDGILPPTAAEAAAEQQRLLRLATAVLLVEVMRAETTFGEAERRAVVHALQAEFGLADDEVADLLGLAIETSRAANDFFTFTSRLNAGFDMTQKVTMIEHLWRVAYADGALGANENHVMRKIADLLYIPQGSYISAKLRATADADSRCSSAKTSG